MASGRRELKEDRNEPGRIRDPCRLRGPGPEHSHHRDRQAVTKVRVGTTPRFRDSATGQWRDAETSYYNVSCWARLADHVRASLHKGDPVIVKGRFRTSTFEDKNGQLRTSIEITADTVGHDLSRGPANYIRLRPQHVTTDDDLADDESTENPDVARGVGAE